MQAASSISEATLAWPRTRFVSPRTGPSQMSSQRPKEGQPGQNTADARGLELRPSHVSVVPGGAPGGRVGACWAWASVQVSYKGECSRGWGSGLTQVSGASYCASSCFRKTLPCFPQRPVLLTARFPLERSAQDLSSTFLCGKLVWV